MLLLYAEELVSHTATSHLSFSQVRRLFCKQDLAHESLFGLLFSRKINYQFKLPFLCGSKAIRKALWMPFLPEQEKEKTTAAWLPSFTLSSLSSSPVPKCKEQEDLGLLQQWSAFIARASSTLMITSEEIKLYINNYVWLLCKWTLLPGKQEWFMYL